MYQEKLTGGLEMQIGKPEKLWLLYTGIVIQRLPDFFTVNQYSIYHDITILYRFVVVS